jgi:hypothetical protein
MDKNKSIVDRFSATQVELAKYVKIEPIEFEDRKGWVAYGEGNHFPQYLIELYNTSPVHGALVNSISFMIAGKEFTAASQVTLREIQRLKLDKVLHSTALDLKLHGGFYWEVIWSMDRSTIAQINHLPYENCRLACSDDNDDVTGVWYSRDWSDTRKKKNNPHYIPFFDVNTKDENPKQVMFQHSMMVGSEYYPKPDYIGSINWIELTRQIGEYHVNNILNGFFPSLIASFNNGIPTLEEQRMIKQQLQLSIQGAENAGKVLTFFNEERDRGVEFTAFPISDSDKQYEFLSTESTNQILIAHRVTSPLLFGIRDGGGLGSNTDELKTSMYLFTKQVIEPFQRIICDGVDEILKAIGVPQGIKIAANDLFIPEQTTEAPVTQSLSKNEITSSFDSEKKKVKHEHQSISKVCCSSNDDFTDEEGKIFIKRLAECGELIDLDEWELISEEEVIDGANESNYISQMFNKMPTSSDANPDDKSNWGDVGLYKLRYAYSQNLSENSREFCKEMVRLSKGGLVFRYEDIEQMSRDGVNGDFAPQGQSTYSLIQWKGGVYCHHFFKRQIYMRKRDSKGRILPNKGLENDKRVGNNPYVPKKGVEGVAPINTPSRGSLKYS